MGRASSTQRPALDAHNRPGGGLGEPGPSGSPILTVQARLDVIAKLHQLVEALVDALAEFSSAGPFAQTSQSVGDEVLLLDTAEAAKLLSLSQAKVNDMANRGEIPSIRIGRAIRIARRPLIAWIEQRTRPASESQVRLPEWASAGRSAEL